MDESPRSRKNSQEGAEPPRGQKRPLEDDAQGTVPKKARTTSSDREEDDGGSGSDSGEAIKPEDGGKPAPKKQKEVKLECASCAAERIAQKACCPLCTYQRNVNFLKPRKQFKAIRKSKGHHHAAEDDRPDSPHEPACADGAHVDLLPFVQRKIWWFAYPPENGES